MTVRSESWEVHGLCWCSRVGAQTGPQTEARLLISHENLRRHRPQGSTKLESCSPSSLPGLQCGPQGIQEGRWPLLVPGGVHQARGSECHQQHLESGGFLWTTPQYRWVQGAPQQWGGGANITSSMLTPEIYLLICDVGFSCRHQTPRIHKLGGPWLHRSGEGAGSHPTHSTRTLLSSMLTHRFWVKSEDLSCIQGLPLRGCTHSLGMASPVPVDPEHPGAPEPRLVSRLTSSIHMGKSHILKNLTEF